MLSPNQNETKDESLASTKSVIVASTKSEDPKRESDL
jgi:hypothetical protein